MTVTFKQVINQFPCIVKSRSTVGCEVSIGVDCWYIFSINCSYSNIGNSELQDECYLELQEVMSQIKRCTTGL